MGGILVKKKGQAKASSKSSSKKTKSKVKQAKSTKRENKAKKTKKNTRKKVSKKVEENHVKKILADSYIRQMLIRVGGENAIAIIRNFEGMRSDEEFVKDLKLKISDVRSTLNKLHNEGLVSYMRKKDSETGWYSYSWKLNIEKMKKWAEEQKQRLIREQTEKEQYYCPACGASSILDFESAVELSFKCTGCDGMLEFLEPEKLPKLWERRI